MRGLYEAYILVKTRDGKQYVCGMNRPPKPKKSFHQLTDNEKHEFLERNCLWN